MLSRIRKFSESLLLKNNELISKYSTLPGLNISPKIITRKKSEPINPILIRDIDIVLTPETCAKGIPDNFIRLQPRLFRKNLLEERKIAERKIQLVDGSVHILPRESQKMRPQTKLRVIEKERSQTTYRKLKLVENIHGRLLSVLSTSIKDPYLNLPVWRITRLEFSSDYRHCYVRWTIDDPLDFSTYAEKITASLHRFIGFFKIEVFKGMNIKAIPELRFQFEDYRAVNIEAELNS